MRLKSSSGRIDHYVSILDLPLTFISFIYLFIVARPRQTCPITGRQAHYLDPRTGVPYADSNAYKVLTQILQHEYIWSPSLGCYVDRVEPPPEAMDDEEGQSRGQETMRLDQDG
jgi:YL1 nuclear protein C-terminal domain